LLAQNENLQEKLENQALKTKIGELMHRQNEVNKQLAAIKKEAEENASAKVRLMDLTRKMEEMNKKFLASKLEVKELRAKLGKKNTAPVVYETPKENNLIQ
jgi:predicted  nucleic acid-binding Zn-ribbon protein